MKEKAKMFVDITRGMGWCVQLPNDRGIITIFKHFKKDSNDAYVKCDREYCDILDEVPTTGSGSVWGTDGSGAGAIYALKQGCFVMNKSGVSKRFCKAVREYIINTPDLNIEV
jgi:hypothetical protein